MDGLAPMPLYRAESERLNVQPDGLHEQINHDILAFTRHDS
jgi:hypothetical protein